MGLAGQDRFEWTDERVAKLKRLWADGLSAKQIADTMHGLSRSAVLGKAYRLRLPMRRTQTCVKRIKHAVNGHAVAVPKPRRVRPPAERRFARPERDNLSHAEREHRAAERRRNVDKMEAFDLPPEHSATAVRLVDLATEHCRWPLGDPRDLNALRFCGAEKYREYSYCERHCRVAYRRP